MIVVSTKGVRSKARREFIELAAKKILGKLINPRTNLDVEIIFKKMGSADSPARKDLMLFGLCLPEEHGRFPRMFTIEISNEMELHEQMITLSHELVHVKQFATNELYEYARQPIYRWRNKKYTNRVYSRRPWERQAYRLQEKLWKEFVFENPEVCKKMGLYSSSAV
jgi:hypothetical protein